MNVSGFNHVTFGVSNLENSLAFYMDILGMRLIHRGRKDAYLEWGTAWVCLVEVGEVKGQPTKRNRHGPYRFFH